MALFQNQVLCQEKKNIIKRKQRRQFKKMIQSISLPHFKTIRSKNEIPNSSIKIPLYDYTYKLMIVGDFHVGKSALLSRYTRNEFLDTVQMNVGVDFATRICHMEDGKKIKAQIWDTPGQKYSQPLKNSYYRDAVGALLVYDVTSFSSFETIQRWLEQFHEIPNFNITNMIVGNKVDLLDISCQREVSLEIVERFAMKYHVAWLETSAKTGYNVDDTFMELIKTIYKRSFH